MSGTGIATIPSGSSVRIGLSAIVLRAADGSIARMMSKPNGAKLTSGGQPRGTSIGESQAAAGFKPEAEALGRFA